MRLICPNCGAQYEVDDSLIPEGGRDVQCSSCGNSWFQMPHGLGSELADELGTDQAPGPAAAHPHEGLDHDQAIRRAAAAIGSAAPALPRIDPKVRDILTSEAEREISARRAEDRIETQDDLGLEPPAPQRREAARISRPQSGAEVSARTANPGPANPRPAIPQPSPASAEAVGHPPGPSGEDSAAAGSRRSRLPDIEEINSSLRSADERREADETDYETHRSRRGGFGTGFLVVVILALVLMLVYVFAGQIAAAVPALEPGLTVYVGWVDGLRIWLDEVARGWVQDLRD